MADVRRYVATRQIIDFHNVIDQLGQDQLICIDRGILSIARALLGSRGMWRTSYSTNYRDSDYDIPSVAEFSPIDEAISDFLARTNDMALCDDIVTNLQEIGQILASSAGCDEEGSNCRSYEEPAEPYTDDEINPPTGYTDYAEYDQHKCDVAAGYVLGVLNDIEWLKTIDTAAVTVAVVGGGLLIPGVNVVGLVGVLLLIIALGVFVGELTAIETWWNSESNSLVCDVYDGVTAQAAYDAVVARIEGGTLTAQQQHIAKFFVSQAAINDAFKFTNVLSVNADCSNCACTYIHAIYGENIVDLGGGSYTIDGEDRGSHFEVKVRLNYNGVIYCGPEQEGSSVSVPGWTDYAPSTNNFVLRDQADIIVGSSPADPTVLEDCGAQFEAVSSTAFTLNITWAACP